MKKLSVFLSIIMILSMFSTFFVAQAAEIVTGTADEIFLTKTATETTDGSIVDEHGNIAQTYDIQLGVQGKKVYPGAKCDVVLAIDLSNSMTNNGSQNLATTKSSAIEFINTVIPDSYSNTRVALVSYGTYARAYNFATNSWDLYGATKTSDVYYTKNAAKAVSVISSNSFAPSTLPPLKKSTKSDYTTYESGGTNTEGGLRITKAVTDTRNNPDAQSYVLFMTDGIPTYHLKYSNGTYTAQGGATTTTVDDFNTAVTAGKELKQAGNEIYALGLFTTYENEGYDNDVAEHLLSARASYKASGTTGNLKFAENGASYITRNYSVFKNDNVETIVNDIYSNLVYKCYALANGTVTDVIPASFELTEQSREALLDEGAKITNNADGTTTVTFVDISAVDEKITMPTISVVNKDGGFGTKYTNSEAKYTGNLYDLTPFDLAFNKPVAGINPWTVNDTAEANMKQTIKINVTSNDLFNKYAENGYDVTDYDIIITDKDGNPYDYTDFTVNYVDGKVEFVSDTAGVKEFYYVVKATADGKDAYAANASETLASRPTKVTVTVNDNAIDLKGLGYAYIFGYEPYISGDTVEIYMAMDDSVTREQVATMITRMITQKYDKMNEVYPVTSNIAAHVGTWYERGFAYEDMMGAFDGPVYTGPITRGEVAKLVACGLNLSRSTQSDCSDVAGTKYEEYINKVIAYGYMKGMPDGTFKPDQIMTRAEFCAMFNNIIDRNSCGLLTKDGVEVTAEMYDFVDMSPDHWAYEICLKATSAYDRDGYVDLTTRKSNIRNVLDKYDSQKEY